MSEVEHLYIHIPFCHRICPYCSFYKHLPGSVDMSGFVDAILTEARLRSERIPLRPRTIYLGGGTPTFLGEAHLERLLTGLRELGGSAPLEEFGLEANPRTVGASKAELLRRLGISRVSLGVQAWDETTLMTLGRDHAPAEAAETFQILRDAGIPSLNIDLMFSIPGQARVDWQGTLDRTLDLQPDHISAYNLNYEEDTEFFSRLKRGEYREDPDLDAEFFFAALDRLEAAGFEHYEISNYARPGHRSAHNEAYWRGADYVGLGPGAFSTHDSVRWRNVADTRQYIDSLRAGVLPEENRENLTEEDRRTERFGLELRTARGLPVKCIHATEERMLETLRQQGLVECDKGYVRLTRAGKPLVDSIAVALMG